MDGWKLIDSTGGGDGTSWDADNFSISNAAGTDRGYPKQLFHLNFDVGERNHLIAAATNNTAIRSELTTVTGRDLLATLDDLRVTETTGQ